MSFFKRPAWAQAQTTEADAESDEASIFRHSNRSHADIFAEQERKRKEKEAKKKKKREKEESKYTAKKEEKSTRSEQPDSKRRRISNEKENDDGALGDVQQPAEHPSVGEVEQKNEDVGGEEDLPFRRSPRNTRHVNRAVSPVQTKPSNITKSITLDESDDSDVDPPLPPPKPPALPVAPQIVEDDSDDEFAILAREARARRLKSDQASKKSQTPDNATHTPGVGASDTRRSTPPPDPTISLFISSRIPNTNPLIVQRRLSQRLQETREAWCKRQNFPPEFSRSVFLIHRLRRAYDVTTCRSLGLEVDAFGTLTMKGAEGKEGVEKVHLEAVTDEIYKQLKDERELEVKRQNGELPPEGTDATEAETAAGAETQAPAETLIRVVLKAKGREDFRLKVKPTTKFSRILAAYAKTQQVDTTNAFLDFDGDRLDPDDEVQASEVSDMDCIDVHLG